MNNRIIGDLTTGEVLGYGVFRTDEQVALLQRLYKKREGNIIYKEQDSFYFLRYSHEEPLFSGLNGIDMVRLLYLATYMNYQNRLQHDNGKPFFKSNIRQKLGISDKSFREFWKKLKEKNIISEKKDGYIYLNKDYFYRGSTLKLRSKIYNYNAIRIYRKSMRDLYSKNNITPLSYVLHLIPYANKKYNIICKNPSEEEYCKIEFFSLEELSKILNYEKSNISALKKKLLALVYPDNTPVIFIDDKPRSWVIVINPKLYYAGTNYEKIEELKIFDNGT